MNVFCRTLVLYSHFIYFLIVVTLFFSLVSLTLFLLCVCLFVSFNHFLLAFGSHNTVHLIHAKRSLIVRLFSLLHKALSRENREEAKKKINYKSYIQYTNMTAIFVVDEKRKRTNRNKKNSRRIFLTRQSI